MAVEALVPLFPAGEGAVAAFCSSAVGSVVPFAQISPDAPDFPKIGPVGRQFQDTPDRT